jgi:DNA processing protein
MLSTESTNLAIISLLELPNVGRKTVNNFLQNFKNSKSIENISNVQSFKNYLLSDREKKDLKSPINESIFLKNDEKSNVIVEKIIDFHDYKIQEKNTLLKDNFEFKINLDNKKNVQFVKIFEIQEIFQEQFTNFGHVLKISKKDWQNASENAIKIFDFSEKLDIKIINYFDEKYPSRLKTISDPPPILYYKGNIDFLSKDLSIAVIGTREPTDYGVRAGEKLGELLAFCNIPLISGLAEGCDSNAQQGCVNNNGQTAAVLAHGLDRIYPRQNEKLAQQIISQKGCLISEYPPGVKPTKFSFVDRDRLQSGLSDAVIVVETGVKGGTMHTVNYCLKQNRILGCISHPSEYLTLPQSTGNQMLISEKKATPINIDYFSDGIYIPEEFNNSILNFIKKITEIKKIENLNFLEIVEEFHAYMYRQKSDSDNSPETIEKTQITKSKKMKTVKIKKDLKEKDKFQKPLIGVE